MSSFGCLIGVQVMPSNALEHLLSCSFASEAPDQAPRELRDGTGPRPAGPPGTDGRTKIALKNNIFPTIGTLLACKFHSFFYKKC